MFVRHLSFLIFTVVLTAIPILALNNGLARTPQMGFNTWNHFGCGINEQLIRDTASTMVSTGLNKFGYEYVNLDDCWASYRDNATRVIPDPKSWPNGMYNLGQYIHGLGLKFGIYSDSGSKTCAGRPGSLGFETIDALTYAAWGVDYLKFDNCNSNDIDPKIRYPVMRDALNATGRPILFSLCEWGVEDPATWAPAVGNSWRTTGDISDNWGSFIGNLDQNDKWWNYSGPGAWNDPDMLEVGNGGMTHDEDVAHFSLWCLIKSPLLIGADITKLTNDSFTILTNREIIAISQDTLGVQGHMVRDNNGAQVWAVPLSDGSVGVILFNRQSSNVTITAQWSDIGISTGSMATVRDLWAHSDKGSYTSSYSATVKSHATISLRITPSSKEERAKIVSAGEEIIENAKILRSKGRPPLNSSPSTRQRKFHRGN